ncbi:MAG: hypothetical protein MZU91_01430 [Desulfosudis oleivorans]|nr:hypothetical protein [Desulfosudis oleivorans]
MKNDHSISQNPGIRSPARISHPDADVPPQRNLWDFLIFGHPSKCLNPYFEGILLGIFFFISGYFAERSFQKKT